MSFYRRDSGLGRFGVGLTLAPAPLNMSPALQNRVDAAAAVLATPPVVLNIPGGYDYIGQGDGEILAEAEREHQAAMAAAAAAQGTGMPTWGWAAIGVGVLAVGFVGYRAMKKRK